MISLLQKEIKNRREAVDEAKKANRADLVADNEAEIKVIESFLPKAMPAEELRAFGEGASIGVLQKAGFVRRMDGQSAKELFALDRASWRAREARVA